MARSLFDVSSDELSSSSTPITSSFDAVVGDVLADRVAVAEQLARGVGAEHDDRGGVARRRRR